MAQAQHGSAPDIQGQDKANPSSLILSAAMLLDWLADERGRPELRRAADAINAAIDELVKSPETAHARPWWQARHQGIHREALRDGRAEPLRCRSGSPPT